MSAYRDTAKPTVAKQFPLHGHPDKFGRIVVHGERVIVEMAIDRDAMGALQWQGAGSWSSVVLDSIAREFIGL